jgi:hypothetical protein
MTQSNAFKFANNILTNGGFDAADLVGAVGGGITMVDQWRLAANIDGNAGDITANLERNDTSGYGGIGTGMTESSGIFTFPSTGIYLVMVQGYWNNTISSTIDYMGLQTKLTINNSTYNTYANGYEFVTGNGYGNTFTASIIDITDVANYKVKFFVETSSANSRLGGNTTQMITGFTFIRLGDT